MIETINEDDDDEISLKNINYFFRLSSWRNKTRNFS